MNLKIGDRLLSMSFEDLDRLYLNEGSEATVYRHGNEVFKIYKDNPLVSKLSVEDVNRLRKLKLKRFIVPKECIFDDATGMFMGYSSDYIDEDSFDKIYSMDGATFKREIRAVLDDIKTLSDNNIEIRDLHLDNIMLSNGKIFFVDPGNFKYTDDYSTASTYDYNEYCLSQFIVLDLIARCMSKKNRGKLKGILSNCDSLEDFLNLMDDNENVKNFSKRIIR